jgi:hypothetical protein
MNEKKERLVELILKNRMSKAITLWCIKGKTISLQISPGRNSEGSILIPSIQNLKVIDTAGISF